MSQFQPKIPLTDEEKKHIRAIFARHEYKDFVVRQSLDPRSEMPIYHCYIVTIHNHLELIFESANRVEFDEKLGHLRVYSTTQLAQSELAEFTEAQKGRILDVIREVFQEMIWGNKG